MPNIRIKDIPTTASATSSTDFIGIDGSANGTRKLDAYSPTFGGNLTVSGTGTHTFGTTNTVTIAAGKISTTGKVGIGTTAHANLQLTVVQPTANAAALWTESVNTLGQSQGVIINAGTNASDFGLVVRNAAQTDMFKVDGASNATLSGNLTVSGTGTSTFSGAIKARSGSADEVGVGPYGTGTGGIYFGNGTVTLYNDANTQLKSLVGLSLGGNLTVSGTGTSSVAGTLNVSGGFILNRINAKGIYTGTSDNCGFTWTGTNGEFSTASGSLILKPAGTTALTLDSSQRCILAGALRLNNAYVSGAPTATGYVTLQDSAGNTYKVLVGT